MMELLTNISAASEVFFTPLNIIIIPFGLFLGIIVGAIPGMTAPMGTALVLPFTFFMQPVPALLLLLGVYKGGIYAGSIPAILFNTPGTVAASCTTLDGYPLTKQGNSRKALDIALYASVAADLISNVMLILFTGLLARLALEFGAPETFSLIFFSLFIISSISGDQLFKGIIAVLFGLFMATVGVDSIFGSMRFAFDNVTLMSGFSILPLLVGLFALSEIFYRLATKVGKSEEHAVVEAAGEHLSFQELKSHYKTIFRSSMIGTVLGAIPGIGAAPAAFFSYSEAKRKSKNPEEYGKGSLEGIAAAESANNAVCSASFIPVLALGIPGGTAAAVILGAFLVQGLTPGPVLFKENLDVVYSLYMGLMIGSIFLLALGYFGIKLFSKLNDLPQDLLFPTVLVMCFFGGFVANNNLFDIKVMLIAGIIGLIFRWLSIPAAPFLIGFILGPLLESAFRETLQQNDGQVSAFFTSPISWFFWALSLFSLYFILKNRLKPKTEVTE
jgi:putative tricarboxylic transport membrane protein